VETVPSGAARSRPKARKGHPDGYVDEERTFWRERADRETRHRAQPFEVSTEAVTLIRKGRVEVSVSDDDLPGGERRADDITGVLRAGRREEQCLGLGCEVNITRVEEYVADPLCKRRPTGLPREKHVATRGAEALSKSSGLNGFSGRLSALEREEDAAHRYI